MAASSPSPARSSSSCAARSPKHRTYGMRPVCGRGRVRMPSRRFNRTRPARCLAHSGLARPSWKGGPWPGVDRGSGGGETQPVPALRSCGGEIRLCCFVGDCRDAIIVYRVGSALRRSKGPGVEKLLPAVEPSTCIEWRGQGSSMLRAARRAMPVSFQCLEAGPWRVRNSRHQDADVMV
jgi:hypothetical protein